MGCSSGKQEAGPQPIYDVKLEEWPAGFVFEKNVITYIDKHRKAAQLIEVGSIVLGVNGETVDEDTFASAYYKATANCEPATLSLQRPQGSVGPQGANTAMTQDSEVSKSLLIDLFLCYFGIFIDVFGITVTTPVVPFLQPVMQFEDVQLGLIMSSYNLASIPGALIIGYLMRKFGTRTASLFSLLGSAVTMTGQGLLLHIVISYADPTNPFYYWLFIAVRILAGLTGSSSPVALTFVGMRVPAREKPKYMAFMAVSVTLAVMTGPLVGGTTAMFSPAFALPFYIGGLVAFVGFFVSLKKLGDARPPKSAGKGEGLPTPVKGIVAIASLKMLGYSSYIFMGPAYYIWKFDMAASEIGSVISLHGIYCAMVAIVLVPRLMKKLGPEGTYLFGACVMCLGMCIVGFMPTWWSFQLIWSPFCGFGFSILNTGINVVADKYATQSTRPQMNAWLFIMDQIGSFLAGILYGSVFQVMRENDAAYILWFTAAGVIGFYAIAIAFVWRVFLIPAQRAKKDKMDKKAVADHLASHAYKYTPDPDPTEEDYLTFGKLLVDLLHERRYRWKSSRQFVVRVLSNYFTEMPVDSMEHRMDVLWAKEHMIKQFAAKENEIDDFYSELGGMMNDSGPDIQRVPTAMKLAGSDAKRR